MLIVAFTGSLREKSANKGVLRAIREMLPEGVELEVLAPEGLPYYNMDLEADAPEPVRAFKERIRQADGAIIVTPEFNGSMPGVLKNALDWVSRPRETSPLRGKPTIITGAGAGGGTASAQSHLRLALGRFGVSVLEQPVVHIIKAWEKFDAEGNLQDEETRTNLRALVLALIKAVEEQSAVGTV